MTTKRCEHCIRYGTDDTGTVCRRRPPCVVIHPHTGAVASVWPAVDPDDWCDEFQTRQDARVTDGSGR